MKTKSIMEVMVSGKEFKRSYGSADSCKGCSALHYCCGIVKEGEIIEPPYLTKLDIRQIEYFTGLK